MQMKEQFTEVERLAIALREARGETLLTREEAKAANDKFMAASQRQAEADSALWTAVQALVKGAL